MAFSQFFNKSDNKNQDDDNLMVEEVSVTETAMMAPPELPIVPNPSIPDPDKKTDPAAAYDKKEESGKTSRPSLDFKHVKHDELIEASEIDNKLEKINDRFSDAIDELVNELKKEVADLDDKIEKLKIQTQAAEAESERVKARIEALQAA